MTGYYIGLLLLLMSVSADGQVVPDVLYAFRGEELFVPCTHGMPEEFVWAVYWHQQVLHANGTIAHEEQILEYDIDEDVPYKVHPEWEDRINFTFPSGNMTIWEMQLGDEHRYQCQARINNMWGIEALTDVIVYDKPISFNISWDERISRDCGSIVPRVVTSADFVCSAVSRPGATVTWSYDVINKPPDNTTQGEIDVNNTCVDAQPFHTDCSQVLSIMWRPNQSEVIRYTCRLTYDFLDELYTQEACIIYDPEPFASGVGAMSALWLLCTVALITTWTVQ